MRSASIGFLLIAAAVCIAGISCTDRSTDEAKKVWQAYVEAVRAGDTAAVKAMYTPESRGYFHLSPDQTEQFKQAKMTLVKTDEQDAYVELQVLSEMSGHQAARFYYLVRSDDRLALQYPFLIFAKSWPTISSTHFVIHRQVRTLTDEDSLSSYQRPPDTAELEKLLTRVTSLTGVQPPGRIDYYFCQNQDEMMQLRGLKGLGGTLVGRCIVTVNNQATWEAAQVMLAGQPRPNRFLYYGLLGWAELQRRPHDTGAQNRANRQIAMSVQSLRTVPLADLIREPSDSLRNTESWMGYWIVGGAIIEELLERKGDSTFRVLYQTSATPDEFEEHLSTLYGLTLQGLQAVLLAKYTWSLPALAQRVDSSTDSTVYLYDEIQYQPKDLDKEPIDVGFFKTEHCLLQCNASYRDSIPRFVAMCERAYEEVARDFDYDRTRCRPQIAILNGTQYSQVTENTSPGLMQVVTPDSVILLLDESTIQRGTLDPEALIRHELAHFVIYQLSGRGLTVAEQFNIYRHPGVSFEEALCQFVELRPGNLSEQLKKQFPTGRFMTVAETDTVSADFFRAITEYRVLVDLLVETYGKEIVPKLGRNLRKSSLPESLQQVTGRPWREVEQQWFDRMRQLVSSS